MQMKTNQSILVRCLDKLDIVTVSISLLEVMGIYWTASSLNYKYPDTEIGLKSRDLVSKWKTLVLHEEEVGAEKQDNCQDSCENVQVSVPDIPAEYIHTPVVQPYVLTPKTTLAKKTAGEERSEQRRRKERKEKERRHNSEKEKERRKREEKKEKERDKEKESKKDNEREKKKEREEEKEEKEVEKEYHRNILEGL